MVFRSVEVPFLETISLRYFIGIYIPRTTRVEYFRFCPFPICLYTIVRYKAVSYRAKCTIVLCIRNIQWLFHYSLWKIFIIKNSGIYKQTYVLNSKKSKKQRKKTSQITFLHKSYLEKDRFQKQNS